ncbi:MAG: TetR/AcrR family transcriptional regulator [Candidatus Nanopelagicales bacterium]
MAARSAKPLSYDRIVRTALAVIDKEGAEGFTLERVATRLGVRAPSLYNHVASKAVIIEGVRDLVVSEMDYSAFGTERWDVALEAWARSYRDAFAAHPNTVTLLYTTPVDADATYVMYEAVTAGLAGGGWPVEMTVPIMAMVEYLIAGSVLDRAASGTMFGQARERGAPTVAVSLHAAGDQVQLADDIFEMGLATLLDGLRRRHRALGLTAAKPASRRRRAV